jgi:phosphodiesterase/alkaline phosphatase D-like protein
MQTDFRKAVIKKELDKNAQKKKPDMPPPGQWDDTETESS